MISPPLGAGMHLLFDERLTDPTGVAVRDALRRGCATANGKRKTGVVKVNEPGAKALASRVLREAEGVYAVAGTRSVTDTAWLGVAWWTAPGDRKLVRVRTWREPWREWSGLPERVAENRDLASRPPVWHLDPERITCVEVDGSAQWVAACGCGAVGSPESLAWAGGMCGPCRDRVEEDGPAPAAREAGVFTAPDFTPWAVGFSPDNRRLVAVGRVGYRVWDVTGELRASGATGHYNTRTATPPVGPGGTLALLNDDDNTLVSLDVAAGRGEFVRPLGGSVRAFWTGEPGELLLQDYGPEGRLRTVTLPGVAVGKPVGPPLRYARLHAVHPDRAAVRGVFCAGGNVVVSRIGRDGKRETLSRWRLGDGPYDRTGNWTQGPEVVRFTPDGDRVIFVHQDRLELWHVRRQKCLVQGQLPNRVADLAFSPDYEHLFILEAGGTLAVCHPGLLTHVLPRARLKWHVRPAASLAVSSDGKLLATAGDEGVKLWPVGRLLEVL